MALTPEQAAAKLDPKAFQALLEPTMRRITLIALAGSQRRTPVLTGNLRRSETTRVEAGGMRGFVGTNMVYGPFVHARVPFFALGIEDSRGTIEGELQKLGNTWAAQVSG